MLPLCQPHSTVSFVSTQILAYRDRFTGQQDDDGTMTVQ